MTEKITLNIFGQDLAFSWANSFQRSFQSNQHWFQVQLDKLYRFQKKFFPHSQHLKKPENTHPKNIEKPGRIRFTTSDHDFNIGARSNSASAIGSNHKNFSPSPAPSYWNFGFSLSLWRHAI